MYFFLKNAVFGVRAIDDDQKRGKIREEGRSAPLDYSRTKVPEIPCFIKKNTRFTLFTSACGFDTI